MLNSALQNGCLKGERMPKESTHEPVESESEAQKREAVAVDERRCCS